MEEDKPILWEPCKEVLEWEVSNTGLVRCRQTNELVHPELMAIGDKPCLYVTCKGRGKAKPFRVHRLVAALFVPNPNNYPSVRHKDRNRMNNQADNLEWTTYSQNFFGAEKKGNAKLSSDAIAEIRRLDNEGVSRSEIAEMFKVSTATISRVVNQKTWRKV